jgi:hypothetical protein
MRSKNINELNWSQNKNKLSNKKMEKMEIKGADKADVGK